MSELDKRINLYKSTIGQIDKLIEETEEQEDRDKLIFVKVTVEKIFENEVKRTFNKLANIFADIFEALSERLRGMFE